MGGAGRAGGGELVYPLALSYLEVMEGGVGFRGVGGWGDSAQKYFNSPQSPEMRTPVCSSCWAGPPLLGPTRTVNKDSVTQPFSFCFIIFFNGLFCCF